jgi:hypothetical protein
MDSQEHAHTSAVGGSPECLLCPVCVLLQAASTSRPEVTQHLVAAGRELTLALKATLDAHAEAHERHADQGDRLQRIRID